MPIASPDAMNNEVPANALNADHEEEEAKCHVENEVNTTVIPNPSISKKSSLNKVNQQDLSSNHGTQPITQLYHQNEKSNSAMQRLNRSYSQSRTISGGLTLNKSNKSLKNLIFYIKTGY